MKIPGLLCMNVMQFTMGVFFNELNYVSMNEWIMLRPSNSFLDKLFTWSKCALGQIDQLCVFDFLVLKFILRPE